MILSDPINPGNTCLHHWYYQLFVFVLVSNFQYNVGNTITWMKNISELTIKFSQNGNIWAADQIPG